MPKKRKTKIKRRKVRKKIINKKTKKKRKILRRNKRKNKKKIEKNDTQNELIIKTKPEWIKASLANKSRYQKNYNDSIKKLNPKCTIEILTPDFKNKPEAIGILSKSLPDVFNHNLETVPRLYLSIRPGSRYFTSLNLLYDIKVKNPNIFTKSGLMVGLGETKEEIYQVMDDLRSANVDFITLGQYLPPTSKHAKLERFVTPKEFEEYKQMAYAKGFLMVASSPLTRSSYHASDDFKLMQENRNKKIKSIQ